MTRKRKSEEEAATPAASLATDPLWREARALFSHTGALRPRLNWFTSMSSRTGPRRLEALTGSRQARRLWHLLLNSSAYELRRFAVRAQVNHEQAKAALRINVIVNISVPLGLLVLLQEVVPALGEALVELVELSTLILAGSIGLGLLLLSLWHAYKLTAQAQDLHHIALLALAERDIAPPAGGAPDTEDDPTRLNAI